MGFGEREITVGNLSKPRGASEEKDGYFPCAALSGPFCSAHITSGPRNEATLLPPAPLVLGAAERDHPDVGGGVSPLRVGVASGLCRHGCVASAFVGRWACDGREAQARGCPFPLPSNRGETSFPSIWRRDRVWSLCPVCGEAARALWTNTVPDAASGLNRLCFQRQVFSELRAAAVVWRAGGKSG